MMMTKKAEVDDDDDGLCTIGIRNVDNEDVNDDDDDGD